MSSEVGASIVLPVKNGGAWLPALLARLRAQAYDGGLEIVAIDSGSTDDSVRFLKDAGARVESIPPEAFDHGETRNRGVREARGEFVVFLSQDALPADEHFVRHLLAALADPRIAGAFARQLPRPEADPLTRRDLLRWVTAQPEPRTVFVPDAAGFEALPPERRHALCVFDNVASAARREVLLAHPFAATSFGEDLEWGQRLLRAGYGLAYVPQATVLHSHPRSARALFRRSYLSLRLLRRLLGLCTVPDVPHLVRAAAATVAGDLRDLVRAGAGPGAFLCAPLQSVAAVYGQYRGARDEARGRPYPGWRA